VAIADHADPPGRVPQVWLSPAFSFGAHVGSVDNLDLFGGAAPWPEARKRVNVFQVALHTVNDMSDDDLARMLAFLESNHIEFALAYGVLTASDACGRGVEGFKPANMAAHVSGRIKRLGGRIRYVAMDEPLFFGHYFNGRNACHWSVEAIARDSAATAKQFRDIFPDVEIGDIEPVNDIKSSDWLELVHTWIEAYQKEAGRPLAFFHDDMIWREPIATRTRMLTAELDSHAIKFGVIFNSRGDVSSDREWLDSVKRNIDEYRASSLKAPDQIIFQSWKPYPSHVLPESDPLTLTHLVNYYFVGR
jgi:hypothetical protein